MVNISNKEQCKELARLMREGCKKTKPLKSLFYARSRYDEFTCALGAILYTKNLLGYRQIEKLREEFPILTHPLLGQIASKNDSGRYTREEIADWLEDLEWE